MTRVRQAFALLDGASAFRLKLTLPMSMVLAVLESLGLALLFPLIQALINPDTLTGGGLMGDLYDLSGASTVNGFIGAVGSAIIALFVVRIALQITFLRWQAGVLATAEARLTSQLFQQYVSRDYAFHASRNSSRLIYMVRGVASSAIWNFLLPAFMLVTDSLVLGALIITLLLVDPAGALSAAGLLGLAGFVYLLTVSRRNRRYSKSTLEVEKRAQRLIQEGLAGIKVMKILGRGARVSNAYAETRDETASYQRRLRFGAQLPRFFLEIALTIALAGIVLVTLSRSDGPEAVASLGLLAVGGFRMLPSFQRVLTGLNTMQTAQPLVDELLEEIEIVGALPIDLGDAEVPGLDFESSITLSELSFRYPGAEVEALHRVDLTIRRGEFIGLVGPSGAGKSTLADILLGLLEPTGGSLEVDGDPIRDERIAAWRTIVGYVPQQTFLFDDSIRANVALGLDPEEVDERRLQQAITAAHLDEVIEGLPDGVDTELGEAGIRLSGGQRQRIGLARALYDQPEVLVLDEATSSLDGVTEAAIAATIEELSEHITVIVIAHRLATVKSCDRLIHLGDGRVLSVGTFAELVDSDPDFRAQASAAGVLWKGDMEAAG